MPQDERPFVRTLHKRGSGMCVVVPKRMRERLGWNEHDAIAYQVVAGSLVLTKVKMPGAPDLREASRRDISA